MTDFMAQMLDELMGPSRNACSTDETIGFDHRDVCKDFLAGFCPNDLFRNTKADLGYCTLRHDENLKESYKNSPKFGKLGYEEAFLERIRGLDRDVRRRIEKHMRRLEGETTDADTARRQREVDDEKRREMTNAIEAKLKEAQKLCEEGNVSGGEALIRESEEMEQERDRLQREQEEKLKRIEQTANELNKPMQVCQVCGCFMLVNDAPSRVDDHLMGKMHMAYARIRGTIDEVEQKKEEERKRRQEEREKREKDREAEKEKDKEKEKDRKKRSRSRSREKKREKSRERDRDSSRRDRDRERDRDHRRGDRDRHSHRDRDRSRDRDRDRRRH